MTGQGSERLATGECRRRGVKTRLIGAILMMLGVLDSLLTLRGGVPAYEFLMLIVFGAIVFAIGAVRGANGPEEVPLASNEQH